MPLLSLAGAVLPAVGGTSLPAPAPIPMSLPAPAPEFAPVFVAAPAPGMGAPVALLLPSELAEIGGKSLSESTDAPMDPFCNQLMLVGVT